MMRENIKGHIAVISANIIFGLGIPVTKYLLDNWLTPNVYMAARRLGAAAIFWAISLFMPAERVQRKDLITIISAGLLGFVVSQTLTAWALTYTSPVYFSLIATLTPIAVMLLALPLLNEKISGAKLLGVLIGVAGAILMVVIKWQAQAGSNDLLGILLALLSLATWAIYLIATRKVSQKYSGVTQMKWIFLASSIVVLPYTYSEIAGTPLYTSAINADWLCGAAALAFIVVFATVLGFFMIPYAMRRLQATTVSVYTNLQPVVASAVAITVAQDIFSWDKPLAAVLVLAGAWLVTKQPKK